MVSLDLAMQRYRARRRRARYAIRDAPCRNEHLGDQSVAEPSKQR
jgi:hypothetical protein